MKNTIIYDRAALYSSNGGASTEDRMLFCKHKWRILREINKILSRIIFVPWVFIKEQDTS